LEVKHLRTSFFTAEGEVKAVNDLSYYVNKGESVAVVGESACGKSVSALSVIRLIPYPPGIIVGGEIIFKGKDILKYTEEEMRTVRGNQIAMIFQEPSTSLNPVLTVSMQLRETLELHRGLDKQAAEEEATKLLKLVGIPDADRRVHDYPYQFSGGMQQRIMIAMGLSCNPELIIADEPTTSLDVTVQAQLLELIDNLREQFGTAIILITHNLGIVARYVDRVNVMYAGKMVETGRTDDIYDNPKHPYTIGLIGSVPRLDMPRRRKLYVIDGLPPHLARLPSGCSFHPRCRYAIDRCKQEVPPLFDMGPEHLAACYRASEMSELLKKERVA
jgi:oligopeptide/dipeptide ABC transporter ATP-binding protein